MRSFASLIALVAATPAFAASGPFFSLSNTNFVVMIAFLIFIGVLIYLKVPGLLGGLLDKRADAIRAELDEAKSLREEAQKIASAQAKAVKEVRDEAVTVAVSAARAVIAKQMTAAQGNSLIDDAIATVETKLH